MANVYHEFIMTSNFILRNATIQDAEAILTIYEPYILNTSITFEYSVPTLDHFRQSIQTILKTYPFFVCELNNKVIGYSYAHQFRERAAYAWDVETSVYVTELYQNQGVASLLYAQLLEQCASRGYHNAYAGITLPNEKSVLFHQKMGFTRVGIFRNAGFKQGKWYSVLFMEKNLIPCDREPMKI